MSRESRAKSGSKKRKAGDSITTSPTISTSSRLKKTKLTTEDSDDDIVVRDSVHINIKLTQQFDKISLNSPQMSLRSKNKDKTTSQPESARKTRASAKEKNAISEINESEEEEEDISVLSEKSEVTRRTRSASKPTRAKGVVSQEAKSYSTAKKTRASSSDTQSNTSSGKKRGRKPKSQLQEIVPTRSSARVPKTSTLKTSYETPVRTPTKSAPKNSGSNQKSGKKGKGTTSKKSLGKIEERDESDTSSTGNFDEETRDDDEASKKSDLEITFNKKKPLKIVRQPVRTPQDKFHQVLKKFDDAILNLQEYTLPDKIPCREDEKKTIKDFIYEGLKNQGHSHCLYISGVPGIGKTVSVLEVIKQIQKENENTETDFNFIHVNGLGLPNPESAYQTILKSMVNIKDMSNSSACVILHNLFQKGTLPQAFKQHKNELDKRVRLVLLDELDYLITKDQNLLYNLFDWPHFKHSKLIIIGIANTMNLPEQLLPKITSRMGNRRLVYKPYTSSQIENILQSRIEKMDIIKPEAITFLSKKIATFSSDIRRTLHVCREALKMCREEFTEKYKNNQESIQEEKLLQIEHIRNSYNSVYSSPYHECISALMDNSKLLLLAICLEMKSKAQPTVNLNEIQDRIKGMLNNLGRKPIPHSETKQIFGQLTSLGLVQGKSKATLKKDSQATGRLNNVMDIQATLKISVDDVTNALRSDELMSKYTDLL